jgi:PAT family beta-lactamase induction signal transducer AmpG
VLWLMAFASASHDIAADGYYMLALKTHQQAAFVGVRSTFYRIANIAGQGGLVYLAGELTERTGSAASAWSTVMLLLAVIFVLVAAYHLVMLPAPELDKPAPRGNLLADSVHVFAEFFKKPAILIIIGYLLLYRFPEAQLLKLATPFLLDPVEQGGLGLSTKQVGIAYGTVGLIALTLGGICGGLVIARFGLKKALWPLILAMHVPNVIFLAMALAHPGSLWIISAALAVEQFGYGLGFTAYLMVMILVADGPHKTAHYAICTGFMALGMMIPGMWSGWLQDQIGYVNFFIWVLVATVPSFAMTALIKVPDNFGKKSET